MKVINEKEIKTQLEDYLKNKKNSGTILRGKIENDLINNGIHGKIKDEMVEYVFSVVSFLKKDED